MGCQELPDRHRNPRGCRLKVLERERAYFPVWRRVHVGIGLVLEFSEDIRLVSLGIKTILRTHDNSAF